MEVAMVIGLIMLMSTQIVPSLAQQDLPGECWKKIGACRKNATTAQQFDVECCPIFIDELNNNTMCFCGLKPILEQDLAVAQGVSQLLNICKIGATFNVICSSDQASSLAPAESIQPPTGDAPSEAPGILMKPPPGLTAESITAFSPASSENKTEMGKPQPGAGNKIAIVGSFSSLLVVITILMF
ncbi:unnamed protein product [Amaranthus hypochondriacus]